MLQKILLKQLRSGETIVLLIREYSIAKVGFLTIVSVLYLVLVFFMYPLLSYSIATSVLFFLGILCIVLYGGRAFIIWYLDVMIVTSDRLIDIERHGIFTQLVKDIEWQSITDISYRTQGVWATLCNYGTVIISTNQFPPIELHRVYQPRQIRDILSEHAKKNRHK